MRVKVSTIIHARTKDIDFRSNLLVVPENFRDEDILWARKYMIDSTRYFELMNEEGRRVVYCNANYIINGISIRIKDLYRKCGKEPGRYNYVDGNRTNYAFIGLVMQKEDFHSAMHIPYSIFLEEYEKIMESRWNDLPSSPHSLENTKASYREMEVGEAERIYDGIIAADKNKAILPGDPALLEGIIARVMQMMLKKNLAFCSNMPNKASIVESHFDIVTSLRAESIIASMQKSDKDKEKKTPMLDNEYTTDKATDRFRFGILLIGGLVIGIVLALGIVWIK